MSAKKLTAVMEKAAEFAKQHGGKLYRHPGGFWAGQFSEQHGTNFGTNTVHGMVVRGAAEYTDWKEGRNGKFPIEITLTESSEQSA